jgi:hypothetical protein
MPARIVRDTIQGPLTKKYGAGDWISSSGEHSLYLNLALNRRRKACTPVTISAAWRIEEEKYNRENRREECGYCT